MKNEKKCLLHIDVYINIIYISTRLQHLPIFQPFIIFHDFGARPLSDLRIIQAIRCWCPQHHFHQNCWSLWRYKWWCFNFNELFNSTTVMQLTCLTSYYIVNILIDNINTWHNIISYYIHPGVGKNTLHFKLSWLSSWKILQFHKKVQWNNLPVCFTTAGKSLSSTTVTLGQAINFLPFERLDTQICSVRRVTIWVDTESWHRCVRSVLEWKNNTPPFPLTKLFPHLKKPQLIISFLLKNPTRTQVMANHGCLHSLWASTWACKGSQLWWVMVFHRFKIFKFRVFLWNGNTSWYRKSSNIQSSWWFQPSNWIISPNKGENKKSLKPPPSNGLRPIWSFFNAWWDSQPSSWGWARVHIFRFPHPSFAGTICTGQASKLLGPNKGQHLVKRKHTFHHT